MSDIVDPLPTMSPAEYVEVQKRRKEEAIKKLARSEHEKIFDALRTSGKRHFCIQVPDEDDGRDYADRAAEVIKEYFEQSGWEVEINDNQGHSWPSLDFWMPGTRAKESRSLKIALGAFLLVALVGIGSATLYMSRPEQPRSNIESLDPEIASLAKKGSFVWVTPNVTVANFPDVGVDSDWFDLYIAPSAMSFDQVVAELKSRGLRPANLRELLLYSKCIPDGSYHLYALGQSWRDQWGYLRFPTAWYGEDRSINLMWSNDWWPKDSKFLAVPIQKLEK